MKTKEMTAQSATVTIGDQVINCYLLANGEYRFSQNGMASIIKTNDLFARRFLEKNGCKPCKIKADLLDTSGRGSGEKLINGVTSDMVTKFWFDQAFKGNQHAQQLVTQLAAESLDIRAAKAFNQLHPEKIQEIQGNTNDRLVEYRELGRSHHACWNDRVCRLGMNPAHTHDLITMKVFGVTAKEARELASLIDHEEFSNPNIGLNHHVNPELMRVYWLVRGKMASYRSGTAQERVNRAYHEITS